MQGNHLQSDTNSARGTLPPALVVSLPFDESQSQDRLGKEAYSYFFVYKAFAPFLRRWAASVVEVTRSESRLDYAIWRCRQAGLAPFHLSFLPLQQTYLSAQAPNIAFPFWEFPDIPCADVVRDPRNDWRRLTDKLSLVLTASTFTRDALLRAGVRQPIQVIPVPVHPAYFSIPDWQPDQRVRMDCPYYTIPQEDTQTAAAESARETALRTGSPVQWARLSYRWTVRPFLPAWARRTIGRAVRSAKSVGEKPQTRANSALELSGVVYTTILNLDDSRKNWTDLVSSVLFALRECDDATLVVKIVAEGERLAQNLGWIEGYRDELALRHRCRL